MSKTRIAIISTLKPLQEPRAFLKMATTMTETNKYDINIIGFSAKKSPARSHIKFHSIQPVARLSIQRLIIPITILLKLFKVKPEIIICNTHELLEITIAIKILFGAKIVYDIQENYYRNILYTRHYSQWQKPLAYLIRLREKALSHMFDHFFLAEKCYTKEMSFIPTNKTTIIENKAQLSDFLRKDQLPQTRSQFLRKFLYTGTIAANYGIWQAINLAKFLHQQDSSICLKIIGLCHIKKLHDQLHEASAGLPFVEYCGSLEAIPHREITEAIMASDVVLLPYQLDKALQNRIPTKLYECLALQKPMIITKNPAWEEICTPYPAALFIDYNHPPASLLREMDNTDFYITRPGNDVFWDKEAGKLLKALDELSSLD